MEKLLMRLDIFKSTGILKGEDYDKIIEIFRYFKSREIMLTEENGSMLITHIVMYMDRVNKGETIAILDLESLEELKEFNEYEESLEIYDSLERIIGKINENEKGYILAHLINLMKGEE